MPKNYKETKAVRQRGRDAHAAAPMHATSVTKPSYTKTGAPRSLSPAFEPWDKTTERAIQARRSSKMKITLPKLPWDKENES